MTFEKKWNNWNSKVNEVSKFQDAVKAKHSRLKKRVIGGGGQKNVAPYFKKPSMRRSLSAPPGFGALGEELDKELLNSFSLQKSLPPQLYDGEQLKPEIREKLLKIAYDFLDSIEIKVKVEDILIVGSCASYNWSRFSDIDLHIVTDYEKIDNNLELVESMARAIGSNWNLKHDIKLYGYDLELYLEDLNNPPVTNGSYSILNDEWVEKPNKDKGKYDLKTIERKAENQIEKIEQVEDAIDEGDFMEAYKTGTNLRKKLKTMRDTGLEDAGIYSIENLAFKLLRRAEQLDRLDNLIQTAYDKAMSIEV
jgi:hypothetical protein